MPALTKFYEGAIHYANVDEFTLREISELIVQMDEYHRREEAEAKAARRNGG